MNQGNQELHYRDLSVNARRSRLGTFYAGPQLEKERQIQAQMQQRQASGVPPAGTPGGQLPIRRPGTPSPGAAVDPAAEQKPRRCLGGEPPGETRCARRLRIDLPCKGARLDDVSFKDYRETVNPNSPNIILLSPAGSPAPYFVECGLHRRIRPPIWSCPAPTHYGRPIAIR